MINTTESSLYKYLEYTLKPAPPAPTTIASYSWSKIVYLPIVFEDYLINYLIYFTLTSGFEFDITVKLNFEHLLKENELYDVLNEF